MFDRIKKLFDPNEAQLRKIQPQIDKINELESWASEMTDDELRQQTSEFRKKLSLEGEKDDADFDKKRQEEILSRILPEAFAVTREAAKRVAGHRHFDVQVMAGYFLANRKIIELFTGEGKTNSANLPLYLYGLTGRGAHLVTVNDYLARRDGEWNGHILNYLGLTVAVINTGTQYRFISDEEAIELKGEDARKAIEDRNAKAKEVGRLKLDLMEGINLVECTKKEAYAADVVYGTNNEFGFDYLRDNMAQRLEDRVQRRLHYAIIDEADSILIDEARTPLIISQGAQASNEMYRKFADVVKSLSKGADYDVDEKANSVTISDTGIDKVEKRLGVKNVYEDPSYAYHLDNALKAKELYTLDDEYIIRDGEIVIVDDFTGRAMPGRRYSEGLHQAIEAKEKVDVKRESKTLATITLQNYFRLYDFMAGMTATALTEAEEFGKIYNLDVVVVPTNKQVIRKDHTDVVYRTQEGKFKAIVNDIREHHEKGQPILVGTASVERSEYLSSLLTSEGIKHNVLNAKYHEQEARIVQDAGSPGQVTIATNMAGRGTDIALGEGVKDLGGLYVIGSERHESRRIDNQLRGRSGRQGDPGESRFFVSFEDELMRKFGGDRAQSLLERTGIEDDMPISIGILGKTIENAQKKVENYNFDIRKRLVEYDDVLNQQREIIYSLRKRVLTIAAETTEAEDLPKDFEISEIEIQSVLDMLDSFSLKDESTWDLDLFGTYKANLSPVTIWVLRRAINEVRVLMASQLKDDMRMDEEEEKSVFDQVQNLLSTEILEASALALGYKSAADLKDTFEDKDDSIVDKEQLIFQLVLSAFLTKLHEVGASGLEHIAKVLILQSIDKYWMEHLDTMGDLREGVGMRSVAQKDPLVEYKNEGYMIFERMLTSIDRAVVSRFFKVQIVRQQQAIEAKAEQATAQSAISGGNSTASLPRQSESRREGEKQQTVVNKVSDVGRNDPCPCGSGKKYKKCHIDKAPSTPEEVKAFQLYTHNPEKWRELYG